jgi:hypothetical protein
MRREKNVGCENGGRNTGATDVVRFGFAGGADANLAANGGPNSSADPHADFRADPSFEPKANSEADSKTNSETEPGAEPGTHPERDIRGQRGERSPNRRGRQRNL